MTETPAQQRFWTVLIAVVALAAGVGIGLWMRPTGHVTDAAPHADTIDVGFAQDMSAHHQQALMMCDMIPVDVAPDVRGMAGEIRIVQWREIGQMMGWLQILDAPLDNPHPMSWMHTPDANAAAHHSDGAPMSMPMAATMPGMSNSAELTKLATSTGHDAEILFLQLMIRHHQGGVDMAADAARRADNRSVKEAALDMVKDQTDEIQMMLVMLDQRGAQVLPYPNR